MPQDPPSAVTETAASSRNRLSSTFVPVLGHQEVGADFKVKKQKVISANSHHQDKHPAPGFSSGGSSGQWAPSCHPVESVGLSQTWDSTPVALLIIYAGGFRIPKCQLVTPWPKFQTYISWNNKTVYPHPIISSPLLSGIHFVGSRFFSQIVLGDFRFVQYYLVFSGFYQYNMF